MIGMPGLAKTMLIRTVSEVLDMEFRRVQFTPDLMPSDITGTDILETDEATGRKEYRFIRGPIFTNILLADEINRTPPKTQAALLEAMQEHRVTAAGQTMTLTPPFFVLATQNPLEQEGTYPLPEAQLDRFMFSIYVDYPPEEDEVTIAKVTTRQEKIELRKVLGGAEILELQHVVRTLPISDHVVLYATRLVRATRPNDPRSPDFIRKWIHAGAGVRASQYLVVGGEGAGGDGRAAGGDVRRRARRPRGRSCGTACSRISPPTPKAWTRTRSCRNSSKPSRNRARRITPEAPRRPRLGRSSRAAEFHFIVARSPLRPGRFVVF